MLKYFFLVFVISNVNATMKEMLDKILNPDPNAQKQKEIVRGRKLLDEMINSNSRSATNNFDVRIADSPRKFCFYTHRWFQMTSIIIYLHYTLEDKLYTTIKKYFFF